jgi:hypothetical protein
MLPAMLVPAAADIRDACNEQFRQFFASMIVDDGLLSQSFGLENSTINPPCRRGQFRIGERNE